MYSIKAINTAREGVCVLCEREKVCFRNQKESGNEKREEVCFKEKRNGMK